MITRNSAPSYIKSLSACCMNWRSLNPKTDRNVTDLDLHICHTKAVHSQSLLHYVFCEYKVIDTTRILKAFFCFLAWCRPGLMIALNVNVDRGNKQNVFEQYHPIIAGATKKTAQYFWNCHIICSVYLYIVTQTATVTFSFYRKCIWKIIWRYYYGWHLCVHVTRIKV